ncbi:MAG: hypothetical protein ACSLFI_04785 [Solirubrobacterales bacterium]
MTNVKEHLSPALVISVVALFVALGGASYAALGKNSVGSKQLKKNAVVTKKVKNSAITTAKIRNNAATGAKVKESSLGTVPRATSAGKADNSTTATTSTSALSAASLDGYRTYPQTIVTATPGATYAAATAAAPENVLFTAGPVTIYSKCITVTGSDTTYLSYYIKTSENGVIFDSDADQANGDPEFLNTGTSEIDRELEEFSTGTDTATVDAEHHYGTGVFTPQGLSFEVQLSSAVKNGNLTNGNGLYGDGNVCVTSGQLNEFNG